MLLQLGFDLVFGEMSVIPYIAVLCTVSCCLLTPSTSLCATLTYKESDRTQIELPFDWFSHVVYLNGPILAGDAADFSALLAKIRADDSDARLVLSLSSVGGVANEGIRISNLVSESGVGTFVETGKQCLSACAFVFMAGRAPPYEGPGYVDRHLHVGGTLGFHAPRLALGGATDLVIEQDVTWGDIATVYDSALHQISSLLLGYGTTGIKWPPSLVGELLRISGPGRYRMIETVDDAGRWHIDLFGFDGRTSLADPRTRFTACMNLYRWTDEDKWLEYGTDTVSDSAYIDGWSKNQEQQSPDENALESLLVYIDMLNAEACNVYRNRETGNWEISLGDRLDGSEVSPEVMLPPSTRIESLRQSASGN
ncbi:hypothetical protein [Mesorhizobium sp.]|uniref:hypothetical protein n=1 Tax=Mesorhizobium sp. TaxID=1871066 RepID=UPI000FE4ACCB|nr:hypothetical protein [Mesorhizobium sp.]RWA97861.1 MAG: hypothetical protein EOQ33_29940 [Mesorhizobium sp.]